MIYFRPIFSLFESNSLEKKLIIMLLYCCQENPFFYLDELEGTNEKSLNIMNKNWFNKNTKKYQILMR